LLNPTLIKPPKPKTKLIIPKTKAIGIRNLKYKRYILKMSNLPLELLLFLKYTKQAIATKIDPKMPLSTKAIVFMLNKIPKGINIAK